MWVCSRIDAYAPDCDHFFGGSQCEDAPVEHQQTVEPIVDAIQIVRRHQHRQAAFDERTHHAPQGLFGFGIDTGGRLVEQQQLRLLCDRTRNEDALLLAARKLRDVPRAQIEHVDGAKRIFHRAAIGLTEDLPKPHPRKPPHRHHIPHRRGKRPIRRLDLRHVSDRAGRQLARLRPKDAHLAARRREQPRNRFEQRGFTRSVRPDDAHRFAEAHVERNAVECKRAFITHDQPVDPNGVAAALVHLRAWTITLVS